MLLKKTGWRRERGVKHDVFWHGGLIRVVAKLKTKLT